MRLLSTAKPLCNIQQKSKWCHYMILRSRNHTQRNLTKIEVQRKIMGIESSHVDCVLLIVSNSDMKWSLSKCVYIVFAIKHCNKNTTRVKTWITFDNIYYSK